MDQFTVIDSVQDINNLIDKPLRHRKTIQQYEAHYSNLKTRNVLKIVGQDQKYQRHLIQIMSFILFGQGLIFAFFNVFLDSPEFLCPGPNDIFQKCPREVACSVKYEIEHPNIHLLSLFKQECTENFYEHHIWVFALAVSGIFSFFFILLADKFGRKNCFFMNFSMQIFLGLAMIVVNNYYAVLGISTIIISLNITIIIHGIVILNESIGGKLRILSVGLGLVSFIISKGIEIILVYAIPDFKINIVIILSIISLTFMGLPFVYDSLFYAKNNWKLKHFYNVMEKILEKNCTGEELKSKKKHLLNYVYNYKWKENPKTLEKFFNPNEVSEKESVFQSVADDGYEVYGTMSFSSYMMSALSSNDGGISEPVSVDSNPHLLPDASKVTQPLLEDKEDKKNETSVDNQSIDLTTDPTPPNPKFEDSKSFEKDRVDRLIKNIQNMNMSRILKRYSYQNRTKINHQTSYCFLFSAKHMEKFMNILYLSFCTVLAIWLTSSSPILFVPGSYFLNQFFIILSEIFCVGLCVVLILFAPRKAILVAGQWILLNFSLFIVFFHWLYMENPENMFCDYLIKPLIYILFMMIKLFAFASAISIILYLCEVFPTFLRVLVLGICTGFAKLSILFVIYNPLVALPGDVSGFSLLALVCVIGFGMAFSLGDSRTNGMLN
jgi:hypothetical protein